MFDCLVNFSFERFHCFFFPELSDIPFGTGHLFVEEPRRPAKDGKKTLGEERMILERRVRNVTEFEEALVAQYFALGGCTDVFGSAWQADSSDSQEESDSENQHRRERMGRSSYAPSINEDSSSDESEFDMENYMIQLPQDTKISSVFGQLNEKKKRQAKKKNRKRSKSVPAPQPWKRHCFRYKPRPPDVMVSAVHAGPGQQSFGLDRRERCDFLMAWHRSVRGRRNATCNICEQPRYHCKCDVEDNFRHEYKIGKPKFRYAVLYYHNFHEIRTHYTGHLPGCPSASDDQRDDRRQYMQSLPDELPQKRESNTFKWVPGSVELDQFRQFYAKGMSEVYPQHLRFRYSVSTSCHYFHGTPIKTLKNRRTTGKNLAANPLAAFKTYPSLTELLHEEFEKDQKKRRKGEFEKDPPHFVSKMPLADVWLPSPDHILTRPFTKSELISKILSNDWTGFVTIVGGFTPSTLPESVATQNALDDPFVKKDVSSRSRPGVDNFGFCVQQARVEPDEITAFTWKQIAKHLRGGRKKGNKELSGEERINVRDFLNKQPIRTFNDITFRSPETISTTYLRWLMLECNFVDFQITHFWRCQFTNQGRNFVLKALNSRHECKQKGEKVAAEVWKLIANGSFGYNGMESSNYDRIRILTGKTLERSLTNADRGKAVKASMTRLTIKHLTFLGIVKVGKKEKNKIQETLTADDIHPSPIREKSKRNKRRKKKNIAMNFADLEAAVSETDNSDNDEDEDIEDSRSMDEFINDDAEFENESENDTDDNIKPRRKKRVLTSEEEDDDDEPAAGCSRWMDDHSYVALSPFIMTESLSPQPVMRPQTPDEENNENHYDFLFAVNIKGNERPIKNCLPKAVAILSNSKVLFLGHVRFMLECLDPMLAEVCYMDTDSIIFSLTRSRLESCILPEMMSRWTKRAIIANPKSKESCHGLMKLEGMYRAGLFRTFKIYRLFNESEVLARLDASRKEDLHAACEEGECTAVDDSQLPPASYTRCKGISRYLANQLTDSTFCTADKDEERPVLHRRVLRATRAGEIQLLREHRSLAVPFNLKRNVSDCGFHTFPLSQTRHLKR